MVTVQRGDEVRGVSRAARAGGARVALVPTMGCLHEGHLELVRAAKGLAGLTVVSIFVNPTQFGPGEDFDRYPRALERDAALLRAEGVDVLFAPPVEEMYPPGFGTFVNVERLAEPLCGARRPGHFRGVATVVAKLFHAVEPDVAVFGEKDYQQLQVIRRMVTDLQMPVTVVGVPTVREADGLALSSRNTYLTGPEREQALGLHRALERAQGLMDAGEERPEALEEAARGVLEAAGLRVDYAEVRHPETLERMDRAAPRALLALAAYAGQTRLIDNRVLVAPGVGEGGGGPAACPNG
ncbi:MAG: pantoate--beta-alanine ligase [Deferrisomatales bacterium]|nr:pantoate--beta-alanine ligase [Deferrisomatales bacterium]